MACDSHQMVDELGQQIERTEAEVELLRSQTKKKKITTGDGRGSELEALNDRRRWHIGKLELIMRLLENGQISPERVGEVKDDIQYYVESNTVCFIMIQLIRLGRAHSSCSLS